jgi:hypothetical protein
VAALGSTSEDPLLRDAACAVETDVTEGQYHSILGPGGPAPPREASYTETVQLGYLLSELSACYGAFAYDPALPEAPDHVAVEASFMSYLRLKQAFALANKDTESAAVTADAADGFLRDHLAVIAEPLSRILKDSAPSYLDLAGRALATRAPSPPRTRRSEFPKPIDLELSLFDCGGT